MNALKHSSLAKNTTFLLIVLMTILGMVPATEASFIPSAASHTQSTIDQDLETVTEALENKIVKQRLNDLGYSDQEIQERLDQLTEEEIHQLAVGIDAVNQGGVFGFVISVLVIVILVIVILRLT
ncbi:MAG: PA2779 family protein [Desulfobacterales bacterium]